MAAIVMTKVCQSSSSLGQADHCPSQAEAETSAGLLYLTMCGILTSTHVTSWMSPYLLVEVIKELVMLGGLTSKR